MGYNAKKYPPIFDNNEPIIDQYRKLTVKQLQKFLNQSKEFVKNYEPKFDHPLSRTREHIGMLEMLIAEKIGNSKRK